MRIGRSHLHVLLALAEGPKHGYGILKDVEERSSRGFSGPGSLYWAIQRLEDAGFLEETEDRAEASAGPKRRDYRLTELGRRRLRDEIEAMSELVELARARRIVGPGETG